uniref:Ig-like domain-containing protein n=1 Tax=Timema tahoe TaxID=61484 RepID=A0A7R9FHC6_9NEOP|nr:unnamed protein product [Timema tahoe]
MARLPGGIELLLALLTVCSCQRSPFISHVSQQQVADTGGSVQLQCSAPYSTGYPVLWIKTDGSVPLSTGCARILPDTRYVVRCDRDTPTYILEREWHLRDHSTSEPLSKRSSPSEVNLTTPIHQLQETDGGWYQCLVLLDSTTRIVAESEVLVRTPPLILDTSTRSVVVDEGGNVTLECHAKGFPTPRIAWRRKDSRTLPGGKAIHRGNTLQIIGVSRSDRGSYLCVADNGVGRGSRRSVAVEVHFQPEVKALKPRVGQALGYDMDLECVVEASPPAVVSWRSKGRPLTDNRHFRCSQLVCALVRVSQFSGSDDVIRSTLRVSNIEKFHIGLYECTATNQLGSNKAEIVLFETVNPTCPPSCEKFYFDDLAT